MVTVLADNKLLVYLDRFSSNEPVAGAKLEVEGAGLRDWPRKLHLASMR
ncbi:MAG: hypothetical protein IPG34_15990 [Rhodocyclaceae bacterium]|nr:hypothetical protein [Rhodocyclaceae bacterium]